MIGISKIEQGRMGNRLLQYHFLRQIAQKSAVDYFHPQFPDEKFFESLEEHKRSFGLFKKTIKMNSKDIIKYSPEEFVNLIKKQDEMGKDIGFYPPLMGEVFFDYLFYPPGDFIKVKKEFREDFKFISEGKIIVGLHFRGTDFKAWNENASLKGEYYINSIKLCLEQLKNQNLIFVLFTDDLNFSAYTDTVDFLKNSHLEYYLGDIDKPAIFDFYKLSQCDVIVSSPSTFAIVAGAVGKINKKIIHAKSWMDYSLYNNDIFWVQLTKTNNPYYSLWKSI